MLSPSSPLLSPGKDSMEAPQKINIQLLDNPAIPLGIHIPRNGTRSFMFTAVVLQQPAWEIKCLSIDDRQKEMHKLHTV